MGCVASACTGPGRNAFWHAMRLGDEEQMLAERGRECEARCAKACMACKRVQASRSSKGVVAVNSLEKKVVDSRSPLEATPPKFGT